jgi:hypothetical protein
MIAVGCDYGIHLDMNTGHCGFEFYRVDPTGRQPQAARPLSESSEAEGEVPRRKELFFRAKKMAREMAHMRFPRYVARDPRDFFYLLLRRSLFDRPPEDGAGAAWQPVPAGDGNPVPLVRAAMGAGRQLYKIDPAQTAFEIADTEPSDALLAVPFGTQASGVATGLRVRGEELRPMQGGESGIAIDGGAIAWREPGQTAGATVVQGLSLNAGRLVPAAHALGFDRDGYLVLASSGQGAADLGKLAKGAGAVDLIVLMAPAAAPEPGAVVRWLVVRSRPKPAAFRIFEEVAPVAPPVWREVYRKQGSVFPTGDGEE